MCETIRSGESWLYNPLPSHSQSHPTTTAQENLTETSLLPS